MDSAQSFVIKLWERLRWKTYLVSSSYSWPGNRGKRWEEVQVVSERLLNESFPSVRCCINRGDIISGSRLGTSRWGPNGGLRVTSYVTSFSLSFLTNQVTPSLLGPSFPPFQTRTVDGFFVAPEVVPGLAGGQQSRVRTISNRMGSYQISSQVELWFKNLRILYASIQLAKRIKMPSHGCRKHTTRCILDKWKRVRQICALLLALIWTQRVCVFL